MIKDANRVKNLQRQIKESQEEVDKLKSKKADLDAEITGKIAKVMELRAQLKSVTSDVVVSEHAILRYLERVEGLNLDLIKEKVLPEDKKEMIKTLGNGKYPVNGHSVVVKGSVVITCYQKD